MNQPTAQAAPIRELTADDIADAMRAISDDGHTLADLKGFTRKHLEALYTVGFNAYNSGNYEQAHKVFQFLCMFDHMEKKYWMALGACRQLMKQYTDAVNVYTYAWTLDADDPTPALHAADCHIALGDRKAAISGLEFAADTAGDLPQYQPVKERAEALLNMFKHPGDDAPASSQAGAGQ